MFAVAICGSPRTNGNTERLLRLCLDELSTAGVDGELIRLSERSVNPCSGCMGCVSRKDRTCSIKTDDFHPIFEALLKADIIVVGSPVYFGSATPQVMALLDRAGFVSRTNGNLLSRKLGGPVAVARRAGHNFTYAQLMFWYMINDMVVPGSTYWNVGLAREPGQIDGDTEALETVRRFSENLAWLATKLRTPELP